MSLLLLAAAGALLVMSTTKGGRRFSGDVWRAANGPAAVKAGRDRAARVTGKTLAWAGRTAVKPAKVTAAGATKAGGTVADKAASRWATREPGGDVLVQKEAQYEPRWLTKRPAEGRRWIGFARWTEPKEDAAMTPDPETGIGVGKGIPADAARPCCREGCGGTYRPIPGDEHYDWDGSANCGLRCDRNCGMESAHYWPWDPDTDPDYVADRRLDDPDYEPDPPAARRSTTSATEAVRKFFDLRASGYTGPIDENGDRATDPRVLDILSTLDKPVTQPKGAVTVSSSPTRFAINLDIPATDGELLESATRAMQILNDLANQFEAWADNLSGFNLPRPVLDSFAQIPEGLRTAAEGAQRGAQQFEEHFTDARDVASRGLHITGQDAA